MTAATKDVPPRIHSLSRLVELASLAVDDEQLEVLTALNRFNLMGRYPDAWPAAPAHEDAMVVRGRVQRVFAWLMKQS